MSDCNKQDKWFLIGDIHGNIDPIRNFYEKNKEMLSTDSSENHIILLGE